LSFEREERTTVMNIEDKATRREEECTDPRNHVENKMWNMSFNRAINKEGDGASVWINPPKVGSKLCSYKISFDCKNNMVEYEALILGLRTLKELGAKRIVVHENSELIINQVKFIYQSKHPRLRAYRNLVLDALEEFSEYNLLVIPRGKNQIMDALATFASLFKIPIFPNRTYEIEVKHSPVLPNNIKY
jgi:ribonuclease HI